MGLGSISTGSIWDKDRCEWRVVVTICYSRNTPAASGEKNGLYDDTEGLKTRQYTL